MANRIVSIEEHNFEPEEQLLLDTNIWLFIFGPQDYSRSEVEIYSSAIRRILAAKSRIFIDILIVSEFINAYSRILWRQSGTNIRFKEFRNSQRFQPIAREVAQQITRVLSYCSYLDSQLDQIEMPDLIGEYAKGGNDFNDQVIGISCRIRNLKLITDDRDFGDQGIAVLTANNNLLR